MSFFSFFVYEINAEYWFRRKKNSDFILRDGPQSYNELTKYLSPQEQNLNDNAEILNPKYF